jgi:hypothetical protein
MFKETASFRRFSWTAGFSFYDCRRRALSAKRPAYFFIYLFTPVLISKLASFRKKLASFRKKLASFRKD